MAMPMTIKSYDEKSYELAEHFLADEPALNTGSNAHQLALCIQEAVEDWFESKRRESTEESDEGVRSQRGGRSGA